MSARLILSDGTEFLGKSIGVDGTVCGTVVFSTVMCGFQEALTDPAFSGEIVCFTDPLVANYGVNGEDSESGSVAPVGVIMKDPCDCPSNFRLSGTIKEFLQKHRTVAISGLDTRALTRHLRDHGAMRGILTTEQIDAKVVFAASVKVPPTAGTDKAIAYPVENAKGHFVLIDFGVTDSTIKGLQKEGYSVTRFPRTVTIQEIKHAKPDGIFISNGPECADAVPSEIALCACIAASKIPTLAVGRGHLVMARAQKLSVAALPFGHHGSHPIKDLERDFVFAALENVNQCVVQDNLNQKTAKITHMDMHDGTVEGLKYLAAPICSLAFQLDFSPSDHNSSYLFKQFEQLINN